MKCCENCVWWHRLEKGFPSGLVATLKPKDSDELNVTAVNDYGQCRRMPPVVVTKEIERRKAKPLLLTLSEFPDTPKTAVCGEWLERPTPDNEQRG